MKRLVFIALMGCGGGKTTGPVAPAAPVEPNLAVLGIVDAQLFAASPTGLTPIAKYPMPAYPKQAVWRGSELVVQLTVENGYEEGRMKEPDPSLDGRIGRLTAKGFELYPEVPATLWPTDAPKPAEEGADEYEHLDSPEWEMVVRADGVFLGRCDYGNYYDGEFECARWSYTRVDQPDGKLLATEPTPLEPKTYSVPTVAAAPAVKVSFAEYKDPELSDEDGSENEPMHQLVCNGTAYPEADDIDLGMDPKSVVWLSTEPPMFQVAHMRAGMDMFYDMVVFEGCTPSTKWEHAELVGGPQDLFAIHNSTATSIRHGGKELGALGGSKIVVFR